MEYLNEIFSAIRGRCSDGGTTHKMRITELEASPVGRLLPFSLYLYIDILEHLELIAFNNYYSGITLTKKGRAANERIEPGYELYALLALYFARQVCLLLLFWPMLVTLQKPHYNGRMQNTTVWGR
jgi:hypothetical protein